MSNEKDIKEFLEFKRISHKSPKGNISDSTLCKYEGDLRTFQSFLKKSFKKATEKDIIKFLSKYKPDTRNNYTVVLRCFYRYLYNLDENEKLPDCIRRIRKIPIRKDDIEYRERVVTQEEYDKLLKYANKSIHKAIIETLWITGGRKSAIQSIKSNGVFYDGKYTHVILWKSKTETREFIHEDRAENLLLWVEEMQPFKNKENKPLFAVKVRGRKDEYKQVNENYANKVLKYVCKRIPDINRRITPHDFRHTKTTNMLKKGVPETHVKTLLGFKKNTNMLKVYDHNRLKDYEEWLEDRKKETKPTYELLEKQKKTLEEKHEKEIESLKENQKRLENLLLNTIVNVFRDPDQKTGKINPTNNKEKEEILKELNKAFLEDKNDNDNLR